MPTLPNSSQFTRACSPVRGRACLIWPSQLLNLPFCSPAQISQAQLKWGPGWRRTSWTTSLVMCRRTTASTISVCKGFFSSQRTSIPPQMSLLCFRTSGTLSLLKDPSLFTHQGNWFIWSSFFLLLALLAYLIILAKNSFSLKRLYPEH